MQDFLAAKNLESGRSGVVPQIALNDLRRHAESTSGVLREALERVLQSGWYILGREGEAFEDEFASYNEARFCIGLANGTDAIELGLKALGIGPGSQVATVANAGFYTTIALNILGAAPVYIDVDPHTMLMDQEHLRQALQTQRIDAVVVTHLYGLMHDMTSLADMARSFGVPLFEDCAQAHGARRDGKRAGTVGVAASFSFYPTKNLGAIGDAGAVLTNDPEVASRVRHLRQYGWRTKYHADVRGGRNSRLDELQAAILRAKLPFLDDWNARRRAIAARYSNEIVNPLVRCPPSYGEEFVGHLFVVTCDRRDELRNHLSAKGIATDVHYPLPDYLQPCMNQGVSPQRLHVTEKLSSSILTLPCYPELTDQELQQVIDSVNNW